MKASRLIKALEKAVAEHGDLDVVATNMGEGDLHWPITAEVMTSDDNTDTWFQIWPSQKKTRRIK